MTYRPESPDQSPGGAWRGYVAAPEVVYLTDVDGQIRWVSPSIEQFLGWRPDELIGGTFERFLHPDDHDRVMRLRDEFYSGSAEHSGISYRLRRRSNDYREVRMASRRLTDPAGSPSGAVMSLTDANDRMFPLRALATLNQASRVLVRAMDEPALLDQMCRAVVTTGGYDLAAYIRPGENHPEVVEAAGATAQLTDMGDELLMGSCLASGTTVVASREPEEASPQALTSGIALPVLVNGEVDGCLSIYCAEPAAFDSLAQEFLENLAADLGYGISRLRDAASAHQYTEDLDAQRQRLRSTIDSVGDPLVLLEAVRDSEANLTDLRYIETNVAALQYNRLTAQELIGQTLLSVFPGQRGSFPCRSTSRPSRPASPRSWTTMSSQRPQRAVTSTTSGPCGVGTVSL